jgi:hypothetical protein
MPKPIVASAGKKRESAPAAGHKAKYPKGLRLAMAVLTSMTGKAGASGRLTKGFPRFRIQFIELFRTVATMKRVGRGRRSLYRWRLFDRTTFEHPWDGTLVRRPRLNCLSTSI